MIDRDPRAPHPDPKIEDAQLQPDPELQMSGGTRANTAQIVLTAVGAIAVIVLVLFGLNHQRDEAPQNPTASAPGTQTTGAAPASPPEAKQQDAQKQQGPGQANNDGKPAQQGGNQGGASNQSSGQAQNEKGSGGASSRSTTGAAPSPPAGAPESAQSSTGGARSGQ